MTASPSRIHRLLHRVLVMLLLVTLAPGARELVTDLGHLLLEGHVAHDEHVGLSDASDLPPTRDLAEATPPAAPSSDHHHAVEHGCSGLFHTCHCCAAPHVLSVRLTTTAPPTAPPAHALRFTLPRTTIADAHREPPFRPPVA